MATSAISSLGNSTNGAGNTKSKDAFGDLSSEDFIKILITELSNQDPLEPVESKQLLEQLNSINSLNVTQQLIDSLGALSTSQSLGSASNLIGRTVTGKVSENSESITGEVEKAVVEDGQIYLVIGQNRLPLENITEVK